MGDGVFLGLREAPRRHGWIRFGILVQTHPRIDPGVDFLFLSPDILVVDFFRRFPSRLEDSCHRVLGPVEMGNSALYVISPAMTPSCSA